MSRSRQPRVQSSSGLSTRRSNAFDLRMRRVLFHLKELDRAQRELYQDDSEDDSEEFAEIDSEDIVEVSKRDLLDIQKENDSYRARIESAKAKLDRLSSETRSGKAESHEVEQEIASSKARAKIRKTKLEAHVSEITRKRLRSPEAGTRSRQSAASLKPRQDVL